MRHKVKILYPSGEKRAAYVEDVSMAGGKPVVIYWSRTVTPDALQGHTVLAKEDVFDLLQAAGYTVAPWRSRGAVRLPKRFV